MRGPRRPALPAGALLGLTGLLGACAAAPVVVQADGTTASVTVDVKNHSALRPGAVRLAAAEYAIDGQAVLSLRADARPGAEVPDAAHWSGALRPGEHVLQATLSYPPRAAAAGDDMEFRVQQTYRFRSPRGAAVRIHVEEAVQEGGGLTASLDRRLGVKFLED